MLKRILASLAILTVLGGCTLTEKATTIRLKAEGSSSEKCHVTFYVPEMPGRADAKECTDPQVIVRGPGKTILLEGAAMRPQTIGGWQMQWGENAKYGSERPYFSRSYLLPPSNYLVIVEHPCAAVEEVVVTACDMEQQRLLKERQEANDFCERSVRCSREGLCWDVGGKCVAIDCFNSESCTLDGQCTAQDNKCVANTDADCVKSRGCKEHEVCHAQKGKCVEK